MGRGPTVKRVWNVAMHELQIFLVCHKHNSLQSSSPFTKELHDLTHSLNF